ncbi:hypothetical protein JCM5296_007077 [Sporobolomyces johnsonii]
MDHPATASTPLSDTHSLHRGPTPLLTSVLPFDVVDLIVDECLSSLGKYDSDRRECAQALSLTCRGLRERAQRALWEDVELGGGWGWKSGRLRAIYSTPRIADMVTNVRWRECAWDSWAPDLSRVEELFLACRNISHVHLSGDAVVYFHDVLSALWASESRSTLNKLDVIGFTGYRPRESESELTEADLQLFLLSFPSLTSFSINFITYPPTLASSSELLNLRTCQLEVPYPFSPVDEPNKPYQSLLDSINLHTLKVFTTTALSYLDWLCRPDFSLNTISLHGKAFNCAPPLLLPQLTRLLPFHPNLHRLDVRPLREPYTPCEDSADLAALCQILSILPPALRELRLPFAIDPKRIPIQQLISDTPGKRLVLLDCWDSTTNKPFWLERDDETADWRVGEE